VSRIPVTRAPVLLRGLVLALAVSAVLAGCSSPSTKPASAAAALADTSPTVPTSTSAAPTSATPAAATPTTTPTAKPVPRPKPTAGAHPSKASKAPAKNGSLAGRVIVIDPGHNGGNGAHPATINKLVDAGFGLRKACNTTGTATNAGYSEAAFTFDVAKRLSAVLRARGAKVVMTRSTNSGAGPCINQRAAIGNAAHASVVVSIHADGNLASGARGFHVIVANQMMGGAAVQRASQRLADDVRGAFRSGTGMPYSTYTGGGKAETHRSDIGGLNLSTRPAVMVETGNMRSATDARLLTSAAFRQRAANALAEGIAGYLS
jgi:N-acetylmuramoyl-L-alanine amidase